MEVFRLGGECPILSKKKTVEKQGLERIYGRFHDCYKGKVILYSREMRLNPENCMHKSFLIKLTLFQRQRRLSKKVWNYSTDRRGIGINVLQQVAWACILRCHPPFSQNQETTPPFGKISLPKRGESLGPLPLGNGHGTYHRLSLGPTWQDIKWTLPSLCLDYHCPSLSCILKQLLFISGIHLFILVRFSFDLTCILLMPTISVESKNESTFPCKNNIAHLPTKKKSLPSEWWIHGCHGSSHR